MVSRDDFERHALLLKAKQDRFKVIESKFNAIKKQCIDVFDEYFSGIAGETSCRVRDSTPGQGVTVTRVVRTTVAFDPDMVEKAIGKKLSQDVIVKKYDVADISGMVAYLKKCNVKPSVFKSFLNITKTVDVKELERLCELGLIDEKQLEGCYSVTKGSSYYRLREGKFDDGD